MNWKTFLYLGLIVLLGIQVFEIVIVSLSIPQFIIDQGLTIFSTIVLLIYLIYYKKINDFLRSKSSFLRVLFLIFVINLPITCLLLPHLMTKIVPLNILLKLYNKEGIYTAAYSNLLGTGEHETPSKMLFGALIVIIVAIIADVFVMKNIASFDKENNDDTVSRYFNLTLYKDMMAYGNTTITALIVFISLLVVFSDGRDGTSVTKDLEFFFYGVYIYILPIQGMLIYLSDKDE